MAIKWFAYQIQVKCDNCGATCTLNVRKGVRIEDFVVSKKAKCTNCGCAIKISEYKTEFLD